eukprot:10170535-Karenia_brevis.AAC.1
MSARPALCSLSWVHCLPVTAEGNAPRCSYVHSPVAEPLVSSRTKRCGLAMESLPVDSEKCA